MMRNTLIITLIICLFIAVQSQASTRNCTKEEKQAANSRLLDIEHDQALQTELLTRHLPLGIPTSHNQSDSEHIFYQGGYILDHDAALRTALWVSYKLTATDINNAVGKDRVNCFRQDPRMTYNQTATPADYKEPIYDQGHMANDADMKDNLTEELNTYLMSNMSPQNCRFNRGVWLSLEELTRHWAEEYKTLYVTSGALFDRNGDAQRDANDQAKRMQSNNGKARVAIPSHYYKIIIRKEPSGWKGITFLLKNTNEQHGVKWKAVRPYVLYSITELGVIERIAGVTFFPSMDRSQFSQQLSDWDLSKNKSNLESSCH